jgi:hypothetical protein
MKTHAEEQNALRQYLLGLLTPEGRTALEERLFTDEAFYEELLIAEDELIDLYLAGRIPDAEREPFESNFLAAPERRKKLRFARALRRRVEAEASSAVDAAAADASFATDAAESETGSRVDGGEAARPFYRRLNFINALRARRPALAFSLAAFALLLLLVGSWALMRGTKSTQGPRRVFAVTLGPALGRGDGDESLTRIHVAPDSDEIHLRLPLRGDEYRSYNAALLSAEGSTILTADGLLPEPYEGGRAVLFRAPPTALPPGDYKLKLTGLNADGAHEPAGSYPFRVLKP